MKIVKRILIALLAIIVILAMGIAYVVYKMSNADFTSPLGVHASNSTHVNAIPIPSCFTRQGTEAGSFAHYLQTLQLKNHAPRANDGTPIVSPLPTNSTFRAIDIGFDSLAITDGVQAVITLRACYLWSQNRHDEIVFTTTHAGRNAFLDFSKGDTTRAALTRYLKQLLPTTSVATLLADTHLRLLAWPQIGDIVMAQDSSCVAITIDKLNGPLHLPAYLFATCPTQESIDIGIWQGGNWNADGAPTILTSVYPFTSRLPLVSDPFTGLEYTFSHFTLLGTPFTYTPHHY